MPLTRRTGAWALGLAALLTWLTTTSGACAAGPAAAPPAVPPKAATADPTARQFRQWGRETLDLIERDFRMPEGGGYFEDQGRRKPAFMWGNFMLLWAFNAAAHVEPATYRDHIARLVAATERYWDPRTNGRAGYDCWPLPKPTDRFYDDNAWMGVGLVEAYRVTGHKPYLQRAIEVAQFVYSGEDAALGGGVWWKETWNAGDPTKQKAVCSSGPAALLALDLYDVTRRRSYLDDGRRVLGWMTGRMQDADGLFWNEMREDGTIGKYKWSYNTAIPMRCLMRLSVLTRDPACLAKARDIARAAEKHWVDPATGTLKCDSMFAFTLIMAWLDLYDLEKDAHWLAVVKRCLEHLHARGRDPQGRYPKRWDQAPTEPLKEWKVLYPAAAAIAYWRAGRCDYRVLDAAPGAGGP